MMLRLLILILVLKPFSIGDYIVDFLCTEKKLIVEVDGGQHNEPNEIEYDNQRTVYLSNLGYKVLRFWNNDVNQNIDGVCEVIKNFLD